MSELACHKGLWPFFFVSCLAACTGTETASVDSGEIDAAPIVRPDSGQQLPAVACDKMDILFVIDNSFSMYDEQQNLIANFPEFIEILNAFHNKDGDAIDYRVGVLTTGVNRVIDYKRTDGSSHQKVSEGEDGVLRYEECSIERPWLERSDVDIESDFACLADVGLNGSSTEMPLEAVRIALTEHQNGANGDFLREDALLAVVIVSDEDDCSFLDDNPNLVLEEGKGLCDYANTAEYIAALDEIKGHRDRWALGAIVVEDESECPDALATIVATRLLAMISQTPDNSMSASICAADLSTSLTEVLETFEDQCDKFPQID